MGLNHENVGAVLEKAELLYDEAAVEAALDRMAAAIAREVDGHNPLLLCVMTGGMVPAAALFTRMRYPAQLDYLHATRYRGGTRGSQLKWICPPSQPLRNRTVLIVDDILDEGLTLAAIMDYCSEQGAERVLSAVLVEKKHDRRYDNLEADFVGLVVDDRYVFGCGMDYHGYLRNLKGIYAVADS